MPNQSIRKHPIIALIEERNAAGLCVLCERPKDELCPTCKRAVEKVAEQWDAVFAKRV